MEQRKIVQFIEKFGPYALAITGIACGATISDSFTTGITCNLLTGFIGKKLSQYELFNLLKHTPPTELNHDLQKVTILAIKLATKALGEFYMQEVLEVNKHNFSKEEYKKRQQQCRNTIQELLAEMEEQKVLESLSGEDIIFYNNELQNKQSEELIESIAGVTAETSENGPAEKITFEEFFRTNFKKYFQIYLGELLKKKKYNPARLAYERMIQKIILHKIEYNREALTEQVKDIEGALDDLRIKLEQELLPEIRTHIKQQLDQSNIIRQVAISQDEINRQLSEIINLYFISKIIIIKEIRYDSLIIENSHHQIQTIENEFQRFSQLIDSVYYVEYQNRLYPVTEFNPETFRFITGKTKYNQLFTRQIIENIQSKRDDRHRTFYNEIEYYGEKWDEKLDLRNRAKRFIAESYIGIIGNQLEKLFAIGIENENNPIHASGTGIAEKYIYTCNHLVKITLRLIIFSFICQLWDDLLQSKITLAEKDKLERYFSMDITIREQWDMLLKLTRLYKKNTTAIPDIIIPEIVDIVELFSEGSFLYEHAPEIENLLVSANLLDCYKAEQYLIHFFTTFDFLRDYHLISMKKIEYYNIKQIEEGYVHQYVNLGNKPQNTQPVQDEHRFNQDKNKISHLFTNSILLYKGDNYQRNINLFPFVIDYNALKGEENSRVLFFSKFCYDESCEYVFPDSLQIHPFEWPELFHEKKHTPDYCLKNNRLVDYHIYCIMATLHEMKQSIFN